MEKCEQNPSTEQADPKNSVVKRQQPPIPQQVVSHVVERPEVQTTPSASEQVVLAKLVEPKDDEFAILNTNSIADIKPKFEKLDDGDAEVGGLERTTSRTHKYVNFVLTAIGIYMIGSIIVVGVDRLPQKLAQWGETDNLPAQKKLNTTSKPPLNHTDNENFRNDFEDQKNFREHKTTNAHLGSHPEIIGLFLLGLGSIGMLHGYFGLANHRTNGRIGRVQKGDGAIMFSNGMITVSGIVSLAGFGFIWKWLAA